MEVNPQLQQYYEYLKAAKADVAPTYESFEKTLADENSARQYHKYLRDAKFDAPESYESFSETLGLKKKVASEYVYPTAKAFTENVASTTEGLPKDEVTTPTEVITPETPQEETLSLKEFDIPTLNPLESVADTVSEYVSGEKITDREYKAKAEQRLSDIDKRLKELPPTQMQTGDVGMGAGYQFNKTPEEEEKSILLEERTKLQEAITDPTKGQYLFGKAYQQSMVGMAQKLITGTNLVSPEWLSKYDSNTLTDVTATALGFMLDTPFFGTMGKIGAKAGQLAAKPIVDRAMIKTAERMIKAGIPEKAAKELALKAAKRTSQIISGVASSATGLGAYGFVGSALSDWSQPGASFDDIKWGNAFKRGGKDTLLGASVGGLGIATAAVASKASAIPSLAGRIGAKAGVPVAGLTAESALFTYGGALLEGRAPKDVTGKEFMETVALLGMLKVSKIPKETFNMALEPKKAAIKIYQSLKYDPQKPGQGQYEVDIEPWEIEAIGGKDYKTVMDIMAKDDAVLGNVMKSDKVPALLKQKLLWGSRGVGIEDINFYGDKVVPNGEYIDIFNKEGVLLDKRRYASRQEAEQASIELGLQVEDNKMQARSAEPDVDRVKIVAELKAKGVDEKVLLSALDKPVKERTPEESKMVGDYYKLIPKPEKKAEETPVVEEEVPPMQQEIPQETPEQKSARLDKEYADAGFNPVYEEPRKPEAPQEDITKKKAVDESLSALEEAVKPEPVVEEAIKDIEKRRQEELADASRRIVDFVETYESNEDGKIRTFQIRTTKDGKKSIWRVSDGKHWNIGKGFDPSVPNEKLLEAFDNIKFIRKESAKDAGISGVEDKINALYDAELEALKSKPQVEEVAKPEPTVQGTPIAKNKHGEEFRIGDEIREFDIIDGQEGKILKGKVTGISGRFIETDGEPVGINVDYATKVKPEIKVTPTKPEPIVQETQKVEPKTETPPVPEPVPETKEEIKQPKDAFEYPTSDDIKQMVEDKELPKVFYGQSDIEIHAIDKAIGLDPSTGQKSNVKRIFYTRKEGNQWEMVHDAFDGENRINRTIIDRNADKDKLKMPNDGYYYAAQQKFGESLKKSLETDANAEYEKETFRLRGKLSDVQAQANADYDVELKKAKLYKLAKESQAPQDKIDEIQKRVKAKWIDRVEKARKELDDFKEKRDTYIQEKVNKKLNITNEEKANTQPDIKVSTGKEDNIPAGTEPAKGGTVKESEAKPVEPTKVEKELTKVKITEDTVGKQEFIMARYFDGERTFVSSALKTKDGWYKSNSEESVFLGVTKEEAIILLKNGLVKSNKPVEPTKVETAPKSKELPPIEPVKPNLTELENTTQGKLIRGVGGKIAELQSRGAKVDNYQRLLEAYEKKPSQETKDKILKLEKELGYAELGNSYFDMNPEIEPVKETPPTENKSDLYKSAEKIIAESTPGRVLADLKDLINKATDIKELKTLLKLPIAMEYKSDIASEIYSRSQYIERHPEKFGQGIYSQPTESKAEELKRREEEIKGTGERKIEVTKDGVKYGDKTYTDIVDVLDDIANGTIKKEDGTVMREEVNKYDDANKPESFANSKTAKQNKRYKNPPNTDKPEELAWDEPLPISTAEDPNFKHSDLNNAMSIRNLGRNLIQNLGLTEGADMRVGFITRFARKARGLFNPRSGVVRVSNVRDLRALTHEIGHKLDFEVFDIRGIISASKTDPLLGTGVDFNGKTYSDVASVEKAMRDHTITIADGNFLLDKVKTFEKDKLAQKYSEIVDASKKKGANLTALRAKYGSAVVDGVLQRATLKKEFMQLLKDINYPKSQQKRTEGIAEFVYNYVVDPKQLINSTPNALAWFEKLLDNAPAIKDALHQMRQDYVKYDAQDILTKGVAEMKAPEEVKTPWLDGIVDLKDKMLYSLVNQLQYLEKRVKQWEKLEGVNKASYKNPWISAKELIGIDGKAQQFLLHHPFLKRGDEIVLRKDIKGLIPIIKHLIGKPEYEIYKSYLVALDAIESHNRQLPRQAYYPKEMALAIKASAEKRYGAAKLMEFQADIQKYNESLLDFAVESGRISKETADYWKREHQNYVPLKRIAEVYEKFKGKKAVTREMIPEAEKAIFARKGSTKTIKDIFESMIENTYSIIGSSERNLHNQNVRDMFQDFHNYNKRTKTGGAVMEEIDARDVVAYQHPVTGEISYSLSKERPSNFKSPKGRILTVFEQGKPRFYDIAPEYYDNIFQSTMETGNLMSKIIRVASAPSRWLQAGAVVYDPTFPIRNVARDQLSSWFYSKHGYMPPDFIKGLTSAIKKDDYYQKWMASGGDQSFLVSADQMITKEYASRKVGPLAQRKFKDYAKNPLRALQDFSKMSEIGTRLGAFRNAYKKTGNVHLAAIESRDIAADYGIKGSVARHFVMFYPFLNARTQHLRMTIGAMKSPSFFLKGMAITIPAILNWLNNNQDEETKNLYQSLSTFRRKAMFNIRIPGTDHFFPLPKGFFGVMFGTSIESVLDAVVKDDPRVLEGLSAQLFKEISPVSNMTETVPFLIRPKVEEWANKKGYTGKPIVSESMKLLKPSEQFYNGTPEIIKKMGEALNWSPVKIQHYFSSYTGGAGTGAINILDEVLQQIGILDQKPEDTFTMLSRMPVFKALWTEKPIGLQSGHISDFYDTLDKIAKVNVTFNKMVNTGEFDKLDKFMKDPDNLRMYSFYEGNSTSINSFRNALGWVRDQGYAIMKDPLLSKQQKQDEVTKINEIVQETVLKFKDAYENKKFFEYGKAMDEIVKKMRDAKKDSRYDLVQQSNLYNPYWMQLREKHTEVFDRLKEFGGMVDIKQTRSISIRGKKVDLELEDVRRFNEEVIQKYGEYVRGRIGTDKETWARDAATPDDKDPEKTRLEVRLKEQWDKASSDIADHFQPTIE